MQKSDELLNASDTVTITMITRPVNYQYTNLALKSRVHGPQPIPCCATYSHHAEKNNLSLPVQASRHLERSGQVPASDHGVCFTHVPECRWSNVGCFVGLLFHDPSLDLVGEEEQCAVFILVEKSHEQRKTRLKTTPP